MEIFAYADGASRGNPGVAGAGVILTTDDDEIITFSTEFLGDNVTNNVAEYRAVILAARSVVGLGLNKNSNIIHIITDSELVVKQLNGEYVVRSEKLLPLFRIVSALFDKIPTYDISHVTRNLNKLADRLANLAINFKINDLKKYRPKK